MAVVKKKKAKPLLIIIIIIAILTCAAGITLFTLTQPVNKKSKAEIEVIIPPGATVRQIGSILKNKGVIKNELIFNVYVKFNSTKPLKASTYTMTKSMTLDEIVKSLESGNSYNPNVIRITFKEGERITDYAEDIATKTNNTYEDVIRLMSDKAYIKTLIDKYWFLTDAVLNENIYYPLEGYLSPNTYEFSDKNVTVETIIEIMLDHMEKELNKYKEKIEKNPHYYLTMASMLEIEGTNTENRKLIAGVFENRLAKNMTLGCDATTYYALQLPMTSDLTAAQFNTNNPYNTRHTSTSSMAGKMPVGPIGNPSPSSIEASIDPTPSDYFYFVADKHGKIYFTKTLAEHNAKIKEIKDKGDWIW